MFIPNWVQLYGSQYITLEAGKKTWDKSYDQQILISKSHLKALDQPTERCSSTKMTPNTGTCIAKFIEEKLGCWTPIYGSASKISAEKRVCDNVTQLWTLNKLTHTLGEADANTVYNITGCLASCEKDEYHKFDNLVWDIDGIIIPTPSSKRPKPRDLKVEFKIMDGSYQEMEQYVVYDFDSFIADIGGFMGLLLGCSVFSLYNDLAGMVEKIKGKVMLK